MLQTTAQGSFSAVRKLECIQAVRRPPVGQSYLHQIILQSNKPIQAKENICSPTK